MPSTVTMKRSGTIKSVSLQADGWVNPSMIANIGIREIRTGEILLLAFA